MEGVITNENYVAEPWSFMSDARKLDRFTQLVLNGVAEPYSCSITLRVDSERAVNSVHIGTDT